MIGQRSSRNIGSDTTGPEVPVSAEPNPVIAPTSSLQLVPTRPMPMPSAPSASASVSVSAPSFWALVVGAGGATA